MRGPGVFSVFFGKNDDGILNEVTSEFWAAHGYEKTASKVNAYTKFYDIAITRVSTFCYILSNVVVYLSLSN